LCGAALGINALPAVKYTAYFTNFILFQNAGGRYNGSNISKITC